LGGLVSGVIKANWGKSPRKMEVFHWETPGEIMGNVYFYGGFNVTIIQKKGGFSLPWS
jgi:hypothetical protein